MTPDLQQALARLRNPSFILFVPSRNSALSLMSHKRASSE
jgi:hypothetical protein